MTKIKQWLNKSKNWWINNKLYIIYCLLVFGTSYIITYVILNLMFINIVTFIIFLIILLCIAVNNILKLLLPSLMKLTKILCKENQDKDKDIIGHHEL